MHLRSPERPTEWVLRPARWKVSGTLQIGLLFFRAFLNECKDNAQQALVKPKLTLKKKKKDTFDSGSLRLIRGMNRLLRLNILISSPAIRTGRK